LVALGIVAALGGDPTPAWADDPPAPAAQPTDPTPARVSYIHGEVSFWRPGAPEWAQARMNTPLAHGDLLYTGPAGTVEIQFGPRAFVRAGNETQIGLDNQEPDYVQFRLMAGHAALDLRELPAGHTVEIATPGAAFTVERVGYYHIDLGEDSVTLRTHRGGAATMTSPAGTAMPVAANQQITVIGTESPRIETGPATGLTAWDNWNYQRTAYLLQPALTQNIPPSVYGGESLAQHGTWRSVESYDSVWVPAGVAPGWVPYSTGRWIWDPRFGWTWLDDAPWGWAPYHYGRWVFVGGYWAWAPGPIVVRPVYAPALVVFLGGHGVTAGVRPVHWAPLGWGEPITPWWGRPGFIGVATWYGWGGPRVVNNVVVNRTTTKVNVTNITVYRNVHVHNAVVAVPADRFGRGRGKPVRVANAAVRDLAPVRGALEVRPVAASTMPAEASGTRPPASVHERRVVATRPPRDLSGTLRAQGLGARGEVAPPAAPRIVATPRRPPRTTATVPLEGPNGRREAPNTRRAEPSTPGARHAGPGAPRPAQERARGFEDKADKARIPDGQPRVPDDRKARAAAPPASVRAPIPPPQSPPVHDPATPQPPPGGQLAPERAAQRGRPDARQEPRARNPGEGGQPGPRDGERPDRGDPRAGR
jgi:hypothetical protein